MSQSIAWDTVEKVYLFQTFQAFYLLIARRKKHRKPKVDLMVAHIQLRLWLTIMQAERFFDFFGGQLLSNCFDKKSKNSNFPIKNSVAKKQNPETHNSTVKQYRGLNMSSFSGWMPILTLNSWWTDTKWHFLEAIVKKSTSST